MGPSFGIDCIIEMLEGQWSHLTCTSVGNVFSFFFPCPFLGGNLEGVRSVCSDLDPVHLADLCVLFVSSVSVPLPSISSTILSQGARSNAGFYPKFGENLTFSLRQPPKLTKL